MPLKPIAIVIALLALAASVWLLITAARHRRRWLSILLRVTPALLLLALVASLGSYIFGFSGPHPFFNRAAPVPASTIIYHLAYSDPRAQHQTVQTWTLIAIQGQTGKTLWQRVWPSSETALTDGGVTVYAVSHVSSDSQLLALNAATGAVRWQKTLPDALINSPPVLARGVLFVGAARLDKQILAFRASDGFQLWSVSIDASANNIALTATSDTLFVQFGIQFGSPNDAFLQARRISDGQLLWSDSPMTGSLVLGSDAVYEISSYGSLVARSAQTRAKLWQFGGHGEFHAGVVSGDTLYVTAQKGGPIGDAHGKPTSAEMVYALDAASGRLRWTADLQTAREMASALRASALVYAGTLIAGRDTVYIQADDGIHALRASDGALRWRSDPRNHWTFSDPFLLPSVVDPVLYVTRFQTLPMETLTLFNPQMGQTYLYAVNDVGGSADWGVTVGPVVSIYSRWLT